MFKSVNGMFVEKDHDSGFETAVVKPLPGYVYRR